ncbi:MAG TPA: rhomboid family intramembrane serine protease [Burkholderiaceae bacterium]
MQRQLKVRLLLLGVPLSLMWAIELVNTLIGHALDAWGIVPRTETGLIGIVCAPFLHGSIAHLASNSLPFLILGWFVMLWRISDFVWVSAIAALIAGLGTWAIAPSGTVHVGASGVIFGYLGFLMLRSYFERSLASILLSLVIGMLYGGLLFGVLPGQIGISWQGHLFGFIGGAIAARLLARRRA